MFLITFCLKFIFKKQFSDVSKRLHLCLTDLFSFHISEGQEDLNDLIGAVAVMETAKRQALEEAEDQEDLNDLIDAVAAMDAAKMSALEEDEDNDFVTSKDSDASPTIAGVTEEVITAEIETKLGNRGVTSNFAKEVLNGKEIIFVIGKRIAFFVFKLLFSLKLLSSSFLQRLLYLQKML